MKVYNCMVNLGGPILHLVPKENISAAEIHLLLHMHGDDVVRNIEETGSVNLSHGALYDYFLSRYGDRAVEGCFGKKTRSLRLPDEIDLDAMYAAPPEDEDGDISVDPTKAALEVAAIQKANAE